MDWIIHLSDEGRLQDFSSSEEFFSTLNQENLQELKKELEFRPRKEDPIE